jgi:hypothetical protein
MLGCILKSSTYGSKEKENLLFCFACLTFFSITVRIIDGGWVCAEDTGKGSRGGSGMYVHIVCVCVCGRALALSSE